MDSKFAHAVDPKDGYPVWDCRNVRYCRVLEFLVPIVHLNKPTRVMITIRNTIFGALEEDRLVDWGGDIPGPSPTLGGRGRKAKTHPHLSLFIPSLQQPRIVAGGRGDRLQDSEGADWIPDHSGTGFKGGE